MVGQCGLMRVPDGFQEIRCILLVVREGFASLVKVAAALFERCWRRSIFKEKRLGPSC